MWVVLDEVGGRGKTTLQKAMQARYRNDILSVQTSRTQDIMYIAQQQQTFRCMQINVSRMQQATLNLGAIELLKDGLSTSTKYKRKRMEMDTPHIFIYTNGEPAWYELTGDRWRIMHLDNIYPEGFMIYTVPEWQVHRGMQEQHGPLQQSSSRQSDNDTES
jgi:hypothetical protein